jgi:predicted DNA-binding protein (UPF0251 family)
LVKGRRKKIRFIQGMPKTVQFSPRGKAGRPDEAELRIDEYEAIKLADCLGYDQSEGAKLMGISRPSFGRILRQARRVVADALVNGKTIRIRIGDVQVGVKRSDLVPRRRLRMQKTSETQQVESEIRQKILDYEPPKSA